MTVTDRLVYGREAIELFSELIIKPDPLINLNNFIYENNIMSETPDVQVNQSDTFKEINVTGQVSNLTYDGLKLTVLHDSLNLKSALSGTQIKASKTSISREIECILNLTPINLKGWAILFQKELERYEKLFGTILSPEEIAEKFKSQPKKMNIITENDVENIKLQMLDEMERAIRMQKANKNLYDYLLSTIQYVIEYAEKHNISLPKPVLSNQLHTITKLIDEVNSHKSETKPTSDQPKGNINNNYRRGNSTFDRIE